MGPTLNNFCCRAIAMKGVTILLWMASSFMISTGKWSWFQLFPFYCIQAYIHMTHIVYSCTVTLLKWWQKTTNITWTFWTQTLDVLKSCHQHGRTLDSQFITHIASHSEVLQSKWERVMRSGRLIRRSEVLPGVSSRNPESKFCVFVPEVANSRFWNILAQVLHQDISLMSIHNLNQIYYLVYLLEPNACGVHSPITQRSVPWPGLAADAIKDATH